MTTPSVGELQRRTAALLAPVAHPRVLAAMALIEETGELAKLLLDHEGYGEPLDRNKVAGELGDILVALAELATRYEVDLEAAWTDKLADLQTRVPRWVEKLGPALERARNKLD